MERGQKREPQKAIVILDCCSRLFLGDDNNSVFTPRGCARELQAGADRDGVEIPEHPPTLGTFLIEVAENFE